MGLDGSELVIRRFWWAMDARDWELVRGLLADGFIAELPVSGERFVGPECFLRMNREYPEGWALTLVRVVSGGERAATEVRSRLGERTEHCVSFYDLRDGQIVRATDWWPEPYPAPAARAHLASPWIERDPRWPWLDPLDDARGALLVALDSLVPAGLAALVEADERALDLVYARAPATRAVVERIAGGDRPSRAPARLYRVRAELRLALAAADEEFWAGDPTDPTTLPGICRATAARERALLRDHN